MFLASKSGQQMGCKDSADVSIPNLFPIIQNFAPHAEVLTVFQGEPIRIKATILPIAVDFVNYTCTWYYERYVVVGRQKVSTSHEVVDCGKRPYLKVDENGRVESYTEELFIPSHKLAPGGTYEITFLVIEERYQMIKWKVKVDTPVKDFTFNVQSSAHFVQFDKVYHVIGAKIQLGCHSRVHVNEYDGLHLFYQRSNKMVPAASVTGADDVFWNTTVHEDLIVVCKIGLFEQGSFHLRVGQRPAVWMKRDPEISGEDPNRVYRGDDITLFCRVHMLADISMFWIYNKTVLDESSIVQSIDGDSVLLKMTIKNISTNNSDCKMSGDPTPFISWSKNGIAMRDNESLLVLPKVDTDDSGVYECVGKNRAGDVRRSISLEVKDDKRRRLMLAFVALSIIFLILLACVLNFIILWRRQKARARNEENAFRVLYDDLINGGTIPAQDRNKQIPLDQQINQIVYDRSKFEISCDDLQISDRRTLGSGQFGKVSMGFLKKPNQINNFTSETPTLKVAVKEPFHAASIRQHIINIQMLADELKFMSLIPPHPNVLTLIGAVTYHLTSGRLCLVTELCANGSLQKFLKNLTRNTFCNELRKAQNSEYMKPDRKNRGNTIELSIIREMSVDVVTDGYIPWTQVESQDEKHDGHEKTPIVQTFLCSTSDLLSFAMQIASGMEFLSEIPCIHRDLAARNILITEKNICRIADFGLARSNKSYYRKDFEKHKNDLLPLQWMSPESIESGYYTQASDVWSYGILLYELFTLGDRPYPGIPLDEIYMRVRNGERNKKPEFVHDDLYNFMLKCWNSKTKERPLFKDCVQKIREHLEMVLPGKAEEIEGKLASEVDRLNSYSEWRNGNSSENKPEIEKQERRCQKQCPQLPDRFSQELATKIGKLTRIIEKRAQEIKAETKNYLKNADNVALKTDTSSSPNCEYTLQVVTAHIVNGKDGLKKSLLIGAFPLLSKKSIDMAADLKKQWSISRLNKRDHLKLNWVNCFGHKLNLVVRRLLKQSFLLSIIDQMKSAVRRIHQSGISRRKFIGLCKEYACPLVVPRSECTLYDELVWNNIKERILFKNDALCLDDQTEPDMRKDPESHWNGFSLNMSPKKHAFQLCSSRLTTTYAFVQRKPVPRFKNLYPIAVQYMSPPASSVSSERVFSMCGLIWKNSRRQRMAPPTLKSALIVSLNQKCMKSRVWPTSLETRYGFKFLDLFFEYMKFEVDVQLVKGPKVQ
ncbi:unnamed protein product, partial [Mesorhabditis belari]|uniref:Receptor protein-tyrosine kinase n=1 Tax=Mesorhabditis belari TaxID=2138241 RepID=A0AAF3F7L0_9BILA